MGGIRLRAVFSPVRGILGQAEECSCLGYVQHPLFRLVRPLYGQEILRHERAGDVAYVTYANGAVLAVNYGETAAQTPGGAVPARDYAVFEGGEKP